LKLYAEYIKEVCDLHIEYTEDYFFTYEINDTYVYLQTVYIKKEKRESGQIDEILKKVYKIAKDNKCSLVSSSICKNVKDEVKSRSHHILTKNLFKEYDNDDNMIYYCRGVYNG